MATLLIPGAGIVEADAPVLIAGAGIVQIEAASGEVAGTPAQNLSYGFGPALAARLSGVLQ